MPRLFSVVFSCQNGEDYYREAKEFYVVAEKFIEAMEKANCHFENVIIPQNAEKMKANLLKDEEERETIDDLSKFVLTKIELEDKYAVS